MRLFDIRSASLEELQGFIKSIDEKPFRATQVFEWIHKRHAQTYNEMTNISNALKAKLTENTHFLPITTITEQTSSDNLTKKLLFALPSCGTIEDNAVNVESVLMTYKHGLSACLSTQAGCKMGCDFCASHISGFVRNLTAGEILGQYYALSRITGERISNIVLMGIGEPLDNFDNTVKFIRLINGEAGVNLSQRNITLSTCGLVPQIYKLIDEGLQINLAISLHAPNDQIRRRMMPIARKYNYDELMQACHAYVKNGRRITFEYIMIDQVNDQVAHAQELVKKIKGINCHVNLIGANPVIEKGYKKSSKHAMLAFKEVLTNAGITTTIRRELGTDIEAACGQLRKTTDS